jgi:hypothetical protein
MVWIQVGMATGGKEKFLKTGIWTGRNKNWNKEFDIEETFTNHLHCVQMMRCNFFLNEWI